MFYHQLRNELWKLFGKKRTYIGFGMLFVAQLLFILLFRFNEHAHRSLAGPLEKMGYPVEHFMSALTMAVAVLIPIAHLLIPLYVALIGGDLMAKEAEDGTLRMILSRPVSRFRILLLKWLAGAVFSVLLAFMLCLCGVTCASIFFPSGGGLFVVMPWDGVFSLYEANQGWQRLAMAVSILPLKAITIMGMALMLSCFNMKPAAATIVALSVFMLSRILQDIPSFAELQPWFITYYLNCWVDVFMQPFPLWKIGGAICLLLGFNATFFVIGWMAFESRDIKS